jgi:hypothetical protein
MSAAIQLTHSMYKLELTVDCFPLSLFDILTKEWFAYVPIRKKQSFSVYKYCDQWQVFEDSFPDLVYSKTFTIDEGEHVTMQITVDEQHPVMCLYSSIKSQLLVTFWYQPDPLPEHWTPSYKRQANTAPVNMRKRRKQLYFEKKNA